MGDRENRGFRLKQYKRKSMMDPKQAEESWKIIESAIQDIYDQNLAKLCFEELYRNAYNMVLHNFGDKIYSGLVAIMSALLETVAKSIEDAQGGSFLDELNRKWIEHVKSMKMIRDILMYMDRSYIPSTHKALVYDLGLNLWRDKVVRSVNIQPTLVVALLYLIERERNGEVIDRGLVRNVIKMLVDLGLDVYQEDFEKPFLEESAWFYGAESQKLIDSNDCGKYLKIAERRLSEETERVSHYLDKSSETKIARIVEEKMIANYMQELVDMENSGLVHMLLNDKYEDLGRMHDLFCRVSAGFSIIGDAMTSHLKATGKQLVTDPERTKNPVEYVQRLLDEKAKYDKIIKLSFNDGRIFMKALNSSFEHTMNLNSCSSEFISLFVDDKLRKGLEDDREGDPEDLLDKVITLFNFLQDKDVFQSYYKKHLSKRLLSGKSVSDDAEKSVLVKLKTECGPHFTRGLERMISDMSISSEIMQEFCAGPGVDTEGPSLSVKILMAGNWPVRGHAPCNLPSELAAISEKFRSFYLGKHNGRKLTWHTSHGHADMKATFGNGQKHELNVSTNQMCILMLFNKNDRLTFKEIEDETKIPTADFKRCLKSLACVKGKNVLMKEPASADIDENDVLWFNDKFTSKHYKLKIGIVTAQESESGPEKQSIMRKVGEDRKHIIDAAVVQVMKSRRRMRHSDLLAEVTEQLQSRFLPQPRVIKKRIDTLIDREYLERDKDDVEVYRYIA